MFTQPSPRSCRMAEAFRSSDEFDEQAHQLYNQGRYDEALETLKDGPPLDPGVGEALLALGDRRAAVAAFDRLLALGFQEDHELMLQAGRSLFRSGLLAQAHRFFELAETAEPECAEVAA